MSADLVAFVDSNVLVYAVSNDEPVKQRMAREIVTRGFAEGCYAISTQVMMEVYVNVTQKAKIALPARRDPRLLTPARRRHTIPMFYRMIDIDWVQTYATSSVSTPGGREHRRRKIYGTDKLVLFVRS